MKSEYNREPARKFQKQKRDRNHFSRIENNKKIVCYIPKQKVVT